MSKIAKDTEKLYDLIESTAQESDHISELYSMSKMAEILGWSRGTVENKCEELQDQDRIQEVTMSKYEGGKKFIPDYMDEEAFKESYKIQKEIEQTRKELKNRILRQPTIEEVAEELGREADEFFKNLFRRSVSDEWRSPDESEINRAKSKVQKRVEEAVQLYFWEDAIGKKIKDGVSKEAVEYYENNEQLFEELEITVTESLPSDIPREFKIKTPPKLRKYLSKPEFTVTVPPDFQEEDERTLDYHERMTEKIRNRIGYLTQKEKDVKE